MLAVISGALAVFCLFLTAGITWFRAEDFRRPELLLLAVPVCFVVAAVAARVAWRQSRHHPPNRRARLCRLLDCPGSECRFPHRLVERAARDRPLTTPNIRRLFWELPAGRVFLLDRRHAPIEIRPLPVAFEPVWMDGREEELQAIIRGQPGDADRSRHHPSAPGRTVVTEPGDGMILVVAGLIIMCIGATLLGGGGPTISLGLLFTCFGLYRVSTACEGWIFPGGLAVRRRHTLGLRRPIRILRATQSTLLVHHTDRSFIVRVQGPGGADARWVRTAEQTERLLAAWCSTAPAPSDEAIRAYFNGRTDQP